MNDNIKDLLNAGAAVGQIRVDHAGIPFVVVPEDYKLEDLERLLPVPVRKRANVVLQDAASFTAYLKKHGKADTCILYAGVDYQASKCNIVASIDDHGTDTPSWREHFANFTPKASHEWTQWTKFNAQPMEQAKFAAFLEDNMSDIASVAGMPSASDMLQMALSFEATSDKRFKRKVDLQGGGVHFEFVDQADDSTSAKFRFFERFTIGIPAFEGSESAYPIQARLKFRQGGDKLVFWFELIRADLVFKQAVKDEIFSITEETGFTLMYGTPGLK